MSARSARVTVTLGAIAAVAALGAWGHHARVAPRQRAAQVRAELAAWEEAYAAARACVTGPAPASTDLAEVIAIRDLEDDAYDPGSCADAFAALRGAPGRWPAQDRALIALLAALSTYVAEAEDAQDHHREHGDEVPLAPLLEELADAHAEVRRAAGRPPLPTAPTRRLPAAEVIPLAAGGGFGIQVGAGLLTLTTADDDFLALRPGEPPLREPIDARRARPAASWVAVVSDDVAAPVLDVASAEPRAVAGAEQATAGMPRLRLPRGDGNLGAALGTLADGWVIKVPDPTGTFAITRVRAGEPPREVRHEARLVTTSVTADGRALVAWTTAEDEQAYAMILGPGASGTPVAIGPGAVLAACLTATHGWVHTGQGDVQRAVEIADRAGRAVVETDDADPEMAALAGCSAEAAVWARRDDVNWALCGASCRRTTARSRGWEEVTASGGALVRIVTSDKAPVLLVEREGAPPRYVVIPPGTQLRTAHADARVVDIVAIVRDPDERARLVLLRVPLT